MNKSDNINELATALAKAQGAMRFAIKDANNPFFKSKYADLSSVVEAIRDALSTNGLSYMQHLAPSEKHEVCVETIILHSSGQWISCGTLTVPVSKHDAQGFGSALTYARRYSLSAAVGVVADDDDGNAAAQAAPKAAAPTAPKAKTTPMPAKVKEALAKGTISGDPMEGDLSGVGPDRLASEETKGKIIHAYANIGFTLPALVKEFGKPYEEWMESDVPDLRDMLKSLKISAANAKAHAAEMAANPDGGEI
jgi:hypothetical protein